MAKNERTSPKISKLAAKVLDGSKKPTKKEVLSMAAELLNLSPDKPKKAKAKK